MNKEGGSAFPEIVTTPAWETSSEGYTIYGNVSSVGGMSLRDYFAGQVLGALLQKFGFDDEGLARDAYILADAMLKAREVDNARTKI